MIYLKGFKFPDLIDEYSFLHPRDLTPEEVASGVVVDRRGQYSKDSTYPFGVLPRFKLNGETSDTCTFNDITILYGTNGCGKTTVLNVISEKLGLKRDGLFNKSQFFSDYLKMCKYYTNYSDDFDYFYKDEKEYKGYIPENSRFIASDDVFNKIFETREHNEKRHRVNAQLTIDFNKEIDACERNVDKIYMKMNRQKILDEKKSEEKREYSNGENALLCFMNNMEHEGLYILDEPENSLSIENQKNLAAFIEGQARFNNSQFIIATHSPFIAGVYGARIYSFEDSYIEQKKWQELSGIKEMYEYFKENEFRFNS